MMQMGVRTNFAGLARSSLSSEEISRRCRDHRVTLTGLKTLVHPTGTIKYHYLEFASREDLVNACNTDLLAGLTVIPLKSKEVGTLEDKIGLRATPRSDDGRGSFKVQSSGEENLGNDLKWIERALNDSAEDGQLRCLGELDLPVTRSIACC